MRHCRECVLFNAKRQTCGTAGEMYENLNHEVEPLGCWCFLPLKNRMHTDCWLWLRASGDPTLGWPDELNASHERYKANH